MGENEPLLFRAVNKVFQDTYEYTRLYREYVEKRRCEEKEDKDGTTK